MGYVDSNLLQGESVVYRTRIHPLIFAGAIVLGALGLFLVVLGLVNKAVIGLFFLGAVLVLIATVQAISRLIRIRTSEFAVTNKRVIVKAGLVRRVSLELLLPKVEAIHVDQGILGRIFNYGTITIVGTGGTKEPFRGIAKPLEFRRQVQGATIA